MRLLKKVGESGYPKQLEDVEGVEDQKSPKRERVLSAPHSTTRSLRTPRAVRLGVKRAYASPPKDEPGEDVFDVFTLAQGKMTAGCIVNGHGVNENTSAPTFTALVVV